MARSMWSAPISAGRQSRIWVTAQVPPLACPGTPLYGALWATLRASKMFFRLKTACRSRFAGVPGQLRQQEVVRQQEATAQRGPNRTALRRSGLPLHVHRLPEAVRQQVEADGGDEDADARQHRHPG